MSNSQNSDDEQDQPQILNQKSNKPTTNDSNKRNTMTKLDLKNLSSNQNKEKLESQDIQDKIQENMYPNNPNNLDDPNQKTNNNKNLQNPSMKSNIKDLQEQNSKSRNQDGNRNQEGSRNNNKILTEKQQEQDVKKQTQPQGNSEELALNFADALRFLFDSDEFKSSILS